MKNHSLNIALNNAEIAHRTQRKQPINVIAESPATAIKKASFILGSSVKVLST